MMKLSVIYYCFALIKQNYAAQKNLTKFFYLSSKYVNNIYPYSAFKYAF